MNKISISFIIVHRNNLLQLKKSINSILLQDIDDRFYIEEIIVSDGNSNITEYSPSHHKHQTGLYWGFKGIKEKLPLSDQRQIHYLHAMVEDD